MNIIKITNGSFGVNNFVIHPEDSNKAVLIDAGEESGKILRILEKRKLELVYLINTHGHADHISGNKHIVEETGAQLICHKETIPFLSDPQLNLSSLFGGNIISPEPARTVEEGDEIILENIVMKILHTPGHSPGHITIVAEDHAFVGDVIFQGSIGRTDLPQSSASLLIETIRNKIYQLPDNTILHPGHGPDTDILFEKSTNPFVRI